MRAITASFLLEILCLLALQSHIGLERRSQPPVLRKNLAAIMRHSFPMSIRDEVHTKCPALGSDNQVAPCTGAVEDMTKDSRQMFQELQAPSWSAGILYYSEPPRSTRSSAGGARSAGS